MDGRPRQPDQIRRTARAGWSRRRRDVVRVRVRSCGNGGGYGERDRAFPTLFALDGAWWERSFIDTHDSVLTPHARPADVAVPFDGPLARLDLKPGTYPGVAFDEPYPDWRGLTSLVLTFVSDLDAPLALRHPRARRERTTIGTGSLQPPALVRPGLNRVVIPLDDVRRAPDRRRWTCVTSGKSSCSVTD